MAHILSDGTTAFLGGLLARPDIWIVNIYSSVDMTQPTHTLRINEVLVVNLTFTVFSDLDLLNLVFENLVFGIRGLATKLYTFASIVSVCSYDWTSLHRYVSPRKSHPLLRCAWCAYFRLHSLTVSVSGIACSSVSRTRDPVRFQLTEVFEVPSFQKLFWPRYSFLFQHTIFTWNELVPLHRRG